MTNIFVYDDTAKTLRELSEKYDAEIYEIIDTLLDEGVSILDDIYLHESLKEDIDFTSFKKELKDTIPEKDIDTYQSDLYVRITPETTALIKKYGIDKHTLLSKFRDNIDHDMWYELPFVRMGEFIGEEDKELNEAEGASENGEDAQSDFDRRWEERFGAYVNMPIPTTEFNELLKEMRNFE